MSTAKAKIKSWQIRSMYAIGSELGIVDRSASKEGSMDELHMMVYNITKKESLKELTYSEANTVITRLKGMMKGTDRPGSKHKKKRASHTAQPGMASEGQVGKLWYLMYELEKFDKPGQVKASREKRLNGFLKKYAGVDDLRFLTYYKANKAIEGLKSLVEREKAKTHKEVEQNA